MSASEQQTTEQLISALSQQTAAVTQLAQAINRLAQTNQQILEVLMLDQDPDVLAETNYLDGSPR